MTARQRQAAELAAQGLTNKEIARDLGIRPTVAKKHVERAMKRLGVNRRAAIGRRLPA